MARTNSVTLNRPLSTARTPPNATGMMDPERENGRKDLIHIFNLLLPFSMLCHLLHFQSNLHSHCHRQGEKEYVGHSKSQNEYGIYPCNRYVLWGAAAFCHT